MTLDLTLILILILAGAGAVGLLAAGCGNRSAPPEPAVLIRVGEAEMTMTEFNRSLDIALTAYPYEILGRPDRMRQLRMRHLEEMIERMALAQRAGELGLGVSEEELAAAADHLRAGYPEGGFEAALLESAVTYPAWLAELSARLLMEKVAQKDLVERMTATDAEIADEVARSRPQAAAEARLAPADRAEIIRGIRRRKAEAAYGEWIDGLRGRYSIEIDAALWAKMQGTPANMQSDTDMSEEKN